MLRGFGPHLRTYLSLPPFIAAGRKAADGHVSLNDTLNAGIENGRIILTPQFRHRSLRERAEAYGGQLNLADETDREEPTGSEVW